jgi:hypothetical protein
MKKEGTSVIVSNKSSELFFQHNVRNEIEHAGRINQKMDQMISLSRRMIERGVVIAENVTGTEIVIVTEIMNIVEEIDQEIALVIEDDEIVMGKEINKLYNAILMGK